MRELKYPIGIQTFETIRNDGYVYVDKTGYIYDIISKGQYYFLSRPRRFGKSLLLSTIEAVFKGKRELFRGLAIDSSDWKWEKHEVLHFDLNPRNNKEPDSLRTILDVHIRNWETQYGISPDSDILVDRFAAIIRKAYHLSGKKVVILVDEYDKPIVGTITDRNLQDEHRNLLQSFYGVLKSLDPFIKFGMLTGISKFSKVSIFSGLNNLEDISLQPQYNAICGITEMELSAYFRQSMEEMARSENVGVDEIHNQLKANYDGYHFAYTDEDIYNPFSLLNAFKRKEFGSYWFETGTPTYLVKLLKKHHYDLERMAHEETDAQVLNSIDSESTNPIPVIYQSGYLTIKGYDERFGMYRLGFPNREVEEGFIRFLLPFYTNVNKVETPFAIQKFVREVESGDYNSFFRRLQSFFADTTYEVIREQELHYENVLFIIFKLIGFYTQVEYNTNDGRIDLVLQTDKFIYIMEFKLEGTAEEALQQINDKHYALPFEMDERKLFKIGVNFSEKTRNIEKWVVE